jgi:phosphate transport system substrate-binding protein
MTITLNLLATLVASVALLGTQPNSPDAGGSVRLDGSSTVYPFAEAVAEEFSKANPKTKVTVGQSGTGGGFKRFGAGEIDFSNASRPIKAGEADACRSKSIEFIELPVALDGLTIVVNPANDWAKQITVDQLKQIYLSTKAAKRWKDLDPSWPDEPIKVYAPGTDSGTFDFFREVVVGKDGTMRADMSVSEQDNVLVRGVAGERNSIGFFGFAYFTANAKKVRAVPVVNPASGKAVSPTPATIEDGSYAPFTRPIFVYASKSSLAKPACLAFAEFMLDQAGTLAREVGYVKLPAAVYDRAKANLRAQRTGTQMTGADGSERHGPIGEIYR